MWRKSGYENVLYVSYSNMCRGGGYHIFWISDSLSFEGARPTIRSLMVFFSARACANRTLKPTLGWISRRLDARSSSFYYHVQSQLHIINKGSIPEVKVWNVFQNSGNAATLAELWQSAPPRGRQRCCTTGEIVEDSQWLPKKILKHHRLNLAHSGLGYSSRFQSKMFWECDHAANLSRLKKS